MNWLRSPIAKAILNVSDFIPLTKDLVQMRSSTTVFACFLSLVTTSMLADEPRFEERADKRWASGGSGGTPDFVRHVVPLFSKLGCNNRACHGSFQGKSGFRLSLFGFEPSNDLKALLEDDGDGLRANTEDPEDSLALYKPTHGDEHGGGQPMEPESWQHRMFRQWITDGARYDPSSDLPISRLELIPSEINVGIDRNDAVALRVIAHFENGSAEDVTGLTVFTSNDDAVATVSDMGHVSVSNTGDTAIIARYAGTVSSTQVLVPAPGDAPQNTVLPHNKIDELVGAKLSKLNIHPSSLSSDGDFLRRTYVDVIGALPTAEEARRFLADRSPDKRQVLIDELLDHPAYARYWGMKFSDWTGNSKYINNKAILSNWLWQQWLEDKLSRNVPYDDLVYGFVCATSLEGRPREQFLDEAATILHKAAGRYNYDDDGVYARRKTNELYWSNVERRKPETMLLQTANSFLGLRLECAQCHNHPFDRWTQQDFEQFKSVFMAVQFCDPETGEEKRGGGRGYGDESVEPGISSRYSTTVKRTPPKLLGGKLLAVDQADADVRVELWEWMRSPDNPYFSPAFVNRLWHHYFGRGIVHPPDDFNQGNPATNPQLLKWLSQELLDHDFDIKHIHRVILNSRTYQTSWEPNDSNRLDKKNFSHAQLRRMPAEVLIDAVADVTGVSNNFGRLPKDQPQRAVGQAMPTLRYGATRGGYPMKIFGRPDREKTCDCERSNEPSVAQALYLINDVEVLDKIENATGRLPRLLAQVDSDREVIAELYLAALTRFPSEDELDAHLKYVSGSTSRAEGMKDVLWSLLNVREFVFVH